MEKFLTEDEVRDKAREILNFENKKRRTFRCWATNDIQSAWVCKCGR